MGDKIKETGALSVELTKISLFLLIHDSRIFFVGMNKGIGGPGELLTGTFRKNRPLSGKFLKLNFFQFLLINSF